ncbi:hypothetical protein LCGC14_3007290, partial [marine sediment metagenome]
SYNSPMYLFNAAAGEIKILPLILFQPLLFMGRDAVGADNYNFMAGYLFEITFYSYPLFSQGFNNPGIVDKLAVGDNITTLTGFISGPTDCFFYTGAEACPAVKEHPCHNLPNTVSYLPVMAVCCTIAVDRDGQYRLNLKYYNHSALLFKGQREAQNP